MCFPWTASKTKAAAVSGMFVDSLSSSNIGCLDPLQQLEQIKDHNFFNDCFQMSRKPTVKWAQRSDKLFITIELPEAKDVKLSLGPDGRFNFSATKDGVLYEAHLELFDKVVVEESKFNVGARNIVYVIKKEEKKWWERLLKQEGKPPVFVKVDWDRWVDEDDENEEDRVNSDGVQFPEASKRKTKKKKKKRARKQILLDKVLRSLKLDCLGK